MVKAILAKVKGMERDYLLFIFVGIFLGIGQSVDGATINNFLKDRFDFLIMQRTLLEIPREMPGLLVFIFTAFLFALGDIRIGVVANLAAASGMFLLGIIPYNFFLMLLVVFIYSTGQHLFMPLFNTIGMSFAKGGQYGRKLGQISAANTASLVISSALLWLLFRYFHISYTVSFTIGALAFLAAAILLMKMNPGRTEPMKNRFVFRKEYKLYYWLCIVYGARKQIFLTFAPWVLVDVFAQKVTTLTMLFFIISTLGIFVKPLIGLLIDRLGEKVILAGESAILILVCLLYAYAADLFGSWAVVIVCACYVLDQTLNAVGMARATYVKKIAVKAEDVSPTLSLGLSIDHVISMFLPVVGGLVWYSAGAGGYKYVFLGGALVALINFISCLFIRVKPLQAEGQQA
ncbi:MAG TPA: MFS transporter [Peptococcaceae bacterium]|nr:MFS transporter [Peptococcaceae bacterium]